MCNISDKLSFRLQMNYKRKIYEPREVPFPEDV